MLPLENATMVRPCFASSSRKCSRLVAEFGHDVRPQLNGLEAHRCHVFDRLKILALPGDGRVAEPDVAAGGGVGNVSKERGSPDHANSLKKLPSLHAHLPASPRMNPRTPSPEPRRLRQGYGGQAVSVRNFKSEWQFWSCYRAPQDSRTTRRGGMITRRNWPFLRAPAVPF